MADILQIQSGGTIVPGRALYVKRQEDERFITLLLKDRDWLNIYGCRTMGKSSLYVQHWNTLKQAGIRPISIDLAAEVGNFPQTGSEWVGELGKAIAAQLGLDDEAFTDSIRNNGAYTTAGKALERLMLRLIKACPQPLALILDEYDYILRLDYCEEILLALRRIKHLQAEDSSFANFSMCFVGLQPLARLGQPGAPETSPIAIPIEMVDFEQTGETVESLMRAFTAEERPSEESLSYLLQLSGGQPLVTMELLYHAKKRGCKALHSVDNLAKELVADSGLGADLQLFENIERAFIAEGNSAYAPLKAYGLLLEENREAHNAPGVEMLRLFGLVRRNERRLEIKGDLFRRRFDAAWTVRMLEHLASKEQLYRGGTKRGDKKICVINTGGTIGMVERGDKVVAPRDTNEFKAYFTALDSIAGDVEFINLFPPLDSINVFPSQWATIAQYIYQRRNDGFAGFVVAHGTDTMAFTASAVAFALGPNLSFPVVFVGAQTTPDVAYGDAHVNLYRACKVAQLDVPEVVISFGNFVYRAVRAQKKDDRRFDGFESPTYPPLAEITGEINVRRELLRALPKRKEGIQLRADFESSVLMVSQFPGLEPAFFDHLLPDGDSPQTCKGVIVQTLGAGNVASEHPYSFIPFVKRAYDQGIPVIVTSQYPPDPGSHTKYTPAQAPIKAGAIHAGNMTVSAAVAKFRWVLAQVMHTTSWHRKTPEMKRNLVCKLMVEQSVVGEF